MDRDNILYRLTDPHPVYGTAGRSYTYEEWKAFPYYDRPIFEKVNADLADYTLKEIINNATTEIYLTDTNN